MKNATSLMVFIIGAALLLPALLGAQETYEEWLKKDQQKFENYLEEEDRAFADFLKRDWKEFQSLQGVKADAKPKPTVPPALPEEKKPEPPSVDPTMRVKDVPVPKTEPRPEPKPDLKPVIKKDVLKFSVFDVDLGIEYKRDFNLQLQQPLNNEQIGKAWEVMGASDYKKLLDPLSGIRTKMRLNDWGYVLLINAASQKILPQDKNGQLLLVWFLLTKSGYEARIAYKDQTLYLLLPNENLIYETRFVTLNDKKYYLFRLGEEVDFQGGIYTYEGNYKGADRLLTMKFEQLPLIRNRITSRNLVFAHKGQSYSIPVKYNDDIVDYLKIYPQTELQVYFSAPVSEIAAYSLLSGLKPYIRGKSELEAVNFLLRFVQTAFQYATDDQQFGKEKYMMPEETFFYPKSDCEDRSILFAYLVRNLLGMEVVALDYPGHIATAVRFNADLPGDAIHYGGRKYLICDPTFINADAGMCMPEYKSVAPKVMMLN